MPRNVCYGSLADISEPIRDVRLLLKSGRAECRQSMSAKCHFRTHARQESWLGAVLVQAEALLINHIAPGKRTLAPSTYGSSASRRDAMATETTSAGWLRSQLLTAPICVD
jgi:hypothetical protein